ncbi:hypothetical protein Pelo_12679 [Pelomyxa schiedti]|nr:hypothetical protein Pelo_12679 [Pelomyxa schiedti]
MQGCPVQVLVGMDLLGKRKAELNIAETHTVWRLNEEFCRSGRLWNQVRLDGYSGLLRKARQPTGKVAHWQMLPDDYGAIVEFRPGKESWNVDALSRIPERALMIVALEDRLIWWREAQAKDKDCQALLAWIGGKSLPERLRTGLNRHDFVTESNVLHRVQADPLKTRATKAVVVPKELRQQIRLITTTAFSQDTCQHHTHWRGYGTTSGGQERGPT